MALVLSSGKVNRYGFRILPEGIRLDNFKSNPCMLLWHQTQGVLPIARLNNLRLQDGQLICDDPEWDETDELAMKIKSKYDKGMMAACSIQVDIIGYSEDPALLMPGQIRPTVTDCELLEVSMVSVPADAGAVKLSHNHIEQLDLDTILPKLAAPESNPKNEGMNIEAIALALGLDATATEAEVLAAVADSKQAVEQVKKNEIENLVTLAKEKGVVNDENEAAFRVVAASVPTELGQVVQAVKLAAATAPQTLTAKMNQLTAGSHPNADDRDSWTFEDWSKKDPNGLLQLKQTNFEKYKNLAMKYAGKAAMIAVLFFLSILSVSGQTWPSGKADLQTLTINSADSTANATMSNVMTQLTITLTKNTTLHLDTSKKIKEGSLLFVNASCGAVAKSLTCGDKLQCPTITGTINKGRMLMFVFDGTKYVLVSNTQYN